MTRFIITIAAALAMTSGVSGVLAAPPPEAGAQTAVVGDLYSGLASGCLSYAKVADLPQGTLIKAGALSLGEKEIADEMAKTPAAMQEQLKKNAFFLAEQLFTQRLILQLAKDEALQLKQDITKAEDRTLVQGFFKKIVEPIKVTDQEVSDFYEANKDMCGGAALDKVKDQLAPYLLGQKQQEAVTRYVKTLGQRMTIEVSAAWAKEQAELSKDNPVGKARASGKPSLVDFGSKGCRPCDMLAPILETLKKKYEGTANVLFISVVEQQLLAARYGIESIPVQIFFDKSGKETFRHVGFYPQEEIEKKMAEMGVM
jgi:thioredoxin 1